MPLALLLLLLVGGGTGVVAENSLPGDILYPVKIHVNENIESALAVTAKGEAEVSVRQAAERLSEAEKLKEKGRLSSDQSIAIRNTFLNEVGVVNTNISKVRAKGDSKSANEVSSRFEKKISEHSSIAGTLGISDDDVDDIDDDSSKENIKNSTKETQVSKKVDVKRVDDDGDDEEENDDDGPRPMPPIQVNTPTPLPPVNVNPGSTGGTPAPVLAKYTLAQVALHSKSGDCWSAVSGGVYNLTSWIAQHPGGASAIISLCGIDGTSGFMAQHGGQGNPERELALFKIGVLQ